MTTNSGRWGANRQAIPHRPLVRLRPLLNKDPEHVVVARGGVVGEDHRQVGGRDPPRRNVDTAAHTLAGAAAAARSALGPVERDETTVEREVRRAERVGRAVEDAAA